MKKVIHPFIMFCREAAHTLLGMGPSCRFEPCCSRYAAQAIETHGVWGVWLAVKRLLRCLPLGGSGFDPVPDITVKGPR